MIFDKDLISIIMPVYNAELYLDDAIQSILNQTYCNFEFIIINDGSTDKSLELINKYQKVDNRICLVTRENRGLIASLNEGIKISRGKYIARMDADDISLKNRLSLQIKLIEDKDLDICGCHYFVIDKDDRYVRTKIVGINENDILMKLTASVPFAHGSVMMRRELLDKNTYGESKFKSVEDYSLWIDMYNNNARFGNVDEFLFKYRSFEESFSGTKLEKMRRERYCLSKLFISKHKSKLKKIVNLKLGSDLKQEEEGLLVNISFSLRYKILLCSKKVSKKNLIISILKFSLKRPW